MTAVKDDVRIASRRCAVVDVVSSNHVHSPAAGFASIIGGAL